MKVAKTRHLPRKPNDVDLHIGRAIHAARSVNGVSQRALSEAIGVSYQQIQKYEAGENRITARRLYQICELFEMPIATIFDGLPTVRTFSRVSGSDLEMQDPHGKKSRKDKNREGKKPVSKAPAKAGREGILLAPTNRSPRD